MNRSWKPKPSSARPTISRHGLSLVDVVITTIVLATTMSLLVPGLYAAAKQREQRKFEVLARMELNNLSATMKSLVKDRPQPALAAWFRSRYPDAELLVEAVPTQNNAWPCGDGLRLSISRAESGDGKSAVISLVIWPGADE